MASPLPHTLLFRNRYLLWLCIVILLVAGTSALINLPRLEDPRITNRNPTVLTFFPGASAERVESLVSKVIEDELRELYEIKDLESVSRAGASIVSVELQDWTDASNNEQIFSKIRDALEDASRQFPPGVSKPEFDDKRGATAFTMVVALSLPSDATEQLTILNRLSAELADRLRSLPGTEIVRRYGDPQEEILVTLDMPQLNAMGLTAGDIAQRIQAADSKQAAGALHSSNRSLLIEVDGALESLRRISDIPVYEDAEGASLHLRDIARIEKTSRDPASEIAFTEADQRSIFVAARMTDNLRVDVWNQSATEVVHMFKEEFGASADIHTLFVQNDYTEERLSNLGGNLLAGMLVVMLVVLVSMGWRPSLVVGLALPLSMAGAIFSLSFFGEEIHQMTMFGMIIAIGLLIDNAIVVTDEVRKNIRERGLSSMAGLSKAVKHLKVPLFASTLTTIIGFMPVFLLPGNIGDFIGPIAISVVMALVFSFVISITLIAALAAIWTGPPQASQSAEAQIPESRQSRWWQAGLKLPRLSSGYRRTLSWGLRHPWMAIGLSLILPILGLALASQLPNVFFPSADRDHFEVQVWLPEESAITVTQRTAQEMNRLINQQAGVARTHWMVGGSTPSVYYNQIMNKDNFASYAQAIVFADNAADANALIPKLQARLDEQFPEARTVVRAFAQGPPSSAPVSFRIVGPNPDVLRELGESVRLALEKQSGVTHAFASIEGGKAKLWLKADEDQARLAGLTLDDIARQFESQLEGLTGGTVLEGLESLPVRVRVDDHTRSQMSRIASLRINSPTLEQWIPAAALGDFELTPELTAITRRNGERVNTVEAFLHPNVAPLSVTQNVLESLELGGLDLPHGYRLEVAGDADAQKEAVGNLVTYAPVLMIVMIATLILAFRSLALAGLIGAVAVLSAGLGFFSLYLSGFPLGFNPIIGTAGLIGVAINGSIVVLAALRANPVAATGDVEAMVGETLGSARHILSTTLTTVAGFTPLLLNGGSFWPPLAVVIAGGVGFSVILSLFFTPAVYALIQRGATRAPETPAEPAQIGGQPS